jgi:hypothetical protein
MTNKTLIVAAIAGMVALGFTLAPLSLDQSADARRVKTTMMTKEFQSMQDPGQGHETHQISIILPPADGITYTGRFTYSASEAVEVVILHDIKPGETPAKIYTIDGEKKWALSLIKLGGDVGTTSGSMSFTGAALALHNLEGKEFKATVTVHARAMALSMIGAMPMIEEQTELYNKVLNPRQISYPAILGFNDLHIEAMRHLEPNGDMSKLETIVHHHCKVYDDGTAACLLFPTGMGDQDKPYGVEYVITAEQFAELPEEEKALWHYHKTELPAVHATLPDMTAEEAAKVKPVLDETYGKVIYFWHHGDKYPVGEPKVVVIQDLPPLP